MVSQSGQLIALIRSLTGSIHTAALVQVLAVTNNGGVDPVGYVDVQPLVGQLDGAGRVIDHAPIYNCRYQRVQGGANAVILDPQVGDVGLAVFCERDITGIKKSGAKGPPGSLRKFSMADAVYCLSVVTKKPAQYIQFNDQGITVHSPSAIVINTPGPVTVNGSDSMSITSSGEIAITSPRLTHNGVNIGSTHVHGGVQSGPSNTSTPH
jgi:hypothetical protein